jgi:hypothetical protein
MNTTHSLEAAAWKAREAAQRYVRELKIDVKDLKFKNIAKIYTYPDSITFITEVGQYVVIEIDENYGDGSEFMFSDIDIEYAYKEGLLPDRLYIPFKDAGRALRDHGNEEATKNRLTNIVNELGVEKVKQLLAEVV